MGSWVAPITFLSTPHVTTAAELNTVRDNLLVLKTQIDDSGLSKVGLRGTFKGLHSRTHPDQANAKSRLYVDHIDEVVMNDGEHVTGWDDLQVDIAGATGVGGLDTGAEAASTWYEYYAIRKPADGSKGIILHKALSYKKDVEQATDNAAAGLRSASARTKLAQGFQVATAGAVEMATVKIKSTGTVPANTQLWATIQGSTANLPNGSVLATSDKIPADLIIVPNAFWLTFVFRVPATLATSTQYHLVLEGDYTISASNFISWQYATSDAYANGKYEEYDGATWAATTGQDFCFRIYVTVPSAALTLPTGYTQYCKLGYAYNNSGSDLIPFMQREREVHYAIFQSLGTFTDAALALLDASAFLPPGPVIVQMGCGNTQAGTGYIYAMPTPYPGHGYGQRAYVAVGSTGYTTSLGEMLTTYQQITGACGIVSSSGCTGEIGIRSYTWTV